VPETKETRTGNTQNCPGKSACRFEQWGWPVYLLIVLVPVAAFWQCLFLPFILDDWAILGLCQTSSLPSLLRLFFTFGTMLLYRPAGATYLTLLFKVFGEIAWPCHLLALGIHILNAAMVFRIMRRLTQEQNIAVLCSLIYAAAVAIHLDPLCWGVGIFDLGGAFFFFTSIILFLSGETFLSLLAFAAGMLFKESTVVLPAVLVAIQLTRQDNWGIESLRLSFRRLVPYFILLLPVLGARMLTGMSPLALPASHPYYANPYGVHVIENLYRYGAWMSQAFLPFGKIDSLFFHVVLGGLLALLVVVAIRRPHSARLLSGLALWSVLALLPVLFMPNHFYRYYATYALPAFICLVLLLVKELLGILGLPRYRNTILAGLGTIAIIASVGQSNRIFGEGFNQMTLVDGSCGLIRRACFVDVVRRQLLDHLPAAEAGATILLGGVDLSSFDKATGPQVWYKNAKLSVYDLTDLRGDERGLYIEKLAQPQVAGQPAARLERIALDPGTLHAFSLKDRTLRPIAPKELGEIAKANRR